MKAAMDSAKEEHSEYIENSGATVFKIDWLPIGTQYEGCDSDALKLEMKRITGSNYLVKTSCDMEVAMAYAKEVASEYNEIRQYGATDSEILFEIDNFVKRYSEIALSIALTERWDKS